MDKDKHNRLKHGMWENTSQFSHEEKLLVWSSAEDYVERLGGEDSLSQAEMYDCYLLALTEFRLARAEGYAFENAEEMLNKKSPEQNLQRLVDRRQDLRKDLGLLSESPDHKQADASSDFFDALSGDDE